MINLYEIKSGKSKLYFMEKNQNFSCVISSLSILLKYYSRLENNDKEFFFLTKNIFNKHILVNKKLIISACGIKEIKSEMPEYFI